MQVTLERLAASDTTWQRLPYAVPCPDCQAVRARDDNAAGSSVTCTCHTVYCGVCGEGLSTRPRCIPECPGCPDEGRVLHASTRAVVAAAWQRAYAYAIRRFREPGCPEAQTQAFSADLMWHAARTVLTDRKTSERSGVSCPRLGGLCTVASVFRRHRSCAPRVTHGASACAGHQPGDAADEPAAAAGAVADAAGAVAAASAAAAGGPGKESVALV